MPYKKLPQMQAITLGCDPEFFFTKDGKVIGSEKIIEKKGIKAKEKTYHYDFKTQKDNEVFRDSDRGLTVIDGVQAELHPKADLCRDRLASNIAQCLLGVEKSMGEGIQADFSQVVEVSKAELDTLSDENKKFGCSASLNTHKKGKNKVTTIKADPTKYLKRSAGGHIHMGANATVTGAPIYKETPYSAEQIEYYKRYYKEDRAGQTYKAHIGFEQKVDPHYAALKNPDVLVPILDIILGNTCVMLDRNPANAERRKNYGKAGEYRLPKYGLEYRTLSNFWLRGKPLFSLVFGLARQAVNMVVCDKDTGHIAQLMALVDMEDITKAINENDMELAVKNWNKIEPFMLAITKGSDIYGHYPITSHSIAGFHKLIDNGIDHYFKQSPMDAWLRPTAGTYLGFSEWAVKIAK